MVASFDAIVSDAMNLRVFGLIPKSAILGKVYFINNTEVINLSDN